MDFEIWRVHFEIIRRKCLLLVLCLCFTPASFAEPINFVEYRTYSDVNGQLYVEAPKNFVLINAEVNIPLVVNKKFGFLKIISSVEGWSVEPLTVQQWRALELTPGHPAVSYVTSTASPDQVVLTVTNQPFSAFQISGLNSSYAFNALNSDGSTYDPADSSRTATYHYDTQGRLLKTTR